MPTTVYCDLRTPGSVHRFCHVDKNGVGYRYVSFENHRGKVSFIEWDGTGAKQVLGREADYAASPTTAGFPYMVDLLGIRSVNFAGERLFLFGEMKDGLQELILSDGVEPWALLPRRVKPRLVLRRDPQGSDFVIDFACKFDGPAAHHLRFFQFNAGQFAIYKTDGKGNRDEFRGHMMQSYNFVIDGDEELQGIDHAIDMDVGSVVRLYHDDRLLMTFVHKSSHCQKIKLFDGVRLLND